MKLIFGGIMLAAVALAGCRSGGGSDERAVAATPAETPTAAPAQLSPYNLISFDIMADGTLVGSFRKTGTDLWEGPSFDSGQIVEWSQEDADSLSLVLYTEDPRIRTLTIYDDDTASSSGLTGNAFISRAAYQ